MKWRLYSASIDRVPSTGNIKFRFYKLIKSGSEGVTELRLTAWKTNLITQQATNAALLLEGATTNVFTQYKGPSFPHIISDGTVLNAAGVMDVSNTLTATWARRGVTESLNIRRLFLLQWLTFNSKPTEILSGTIHQKGEVITPMSVIKDKDGVSAVRYVMTSYSFSLGSGIGSGSYRELVTVDANINAFQEFLDSIRLGDFFPQTINYNIFIGGAPGLSPGANPGQIDLNFSLNGDVRGGLNQAELTPASIQNKARLDTTGLTGTDIVIGAVKDDPSQENMTNLRLSDTYPILDTNFVPYTGAKSNVELGEKGIRSGYYRFDTTPTSTPTDQGTMYWDEDDNTVDIVLNGYIMKVGEDQFYPVKNQTGSNIPKGTSVRFAGTVGSSGRLLIAPFLADGTFPSTRFMGVTAEDIDNGEDGKVLWFGRLRGINTSAFAEGDILYASTTVAGGFQTTVPVAPNNIVEIAAVVTDATNGTIFIRPQFIQSLDGVVLTTTNQSIAGVKTFTGQLSVTGTFLSLPTALNQRDKLRIFGASSEWAIGNQGSTTFGRLNDTAITFNVPNNNSQGWWWGDSGHSSAQGAMALTSNGNLTVANSLRLGYGESDTNDTVDYDGDILGALRIRSEGVTSFRLENSSGIPKVIYSPDGFWVSLDPASNSIFKIYGSDFTTELFSIDNVGTVRLWDTNIQLSTTTGTKIGTATNQKLGFWNKTPIVQPTTAITGATIAGSGGTNITTNSTFDGYTLAQVVKALRDAGLLA
jgi:hypothetical protein